MLMRSAHARQHHAHIRSALARQHCTHPQRSASTSSAYSAYSSCHGVALGSAQRAAVLGTHILLQLRPEATGLHGIGVALADPKAIEQLVISQGVQYRISHAGCIVLHCSCRTELIRARVLEGVELACAIPMHIEECTPMPSGLIAQRSIGVETTMP